MDLLNRLTDYRNINLAFERTKNTHMNREISSNHEQDLFEGCTPKIYTYIKERLKQPDKFQFLPIEILNKPKKKINETWVMRPLARISFFDAVVAQCVLNVISEFISPLLATENFGYKIQNTNSIYFYQRWQEGYSKFVEQEIKALDETSHYKYLIELDIEQFYPSINHQTLLSAISKHIVKPNLEYGDILLLWLKKILNIPQVDYKGERIDIQGLPQGTLYSPILAMFYLKDVFRTLKNKGLLTRSKYFAYVDDFRFYFERKAQANKTFDSLKKILRVELSLSVNDLKSKVVRLDDNKKLEAKLMGKASNLNRAINDDVILAVDGNVKMKNNLLNLLDEAKKVFGNENDKFIERLNKFVSYRVTRLITTSEEWNKGYDRITTDELLGSNLVAMLHVLFITTSTVRDRQRLLDLFEKLATEPQFEEISYVRYLAFQYLFRWSPSELRLSNIRRKEIVALLESITSKPLYLKAAMSRCHEEWYRYFRELVNARPLSADDRELLAALHVIHKKDSPYLPTLYQKRSVTPRLVQKDNILRYTIFSPYWEDPGYLHDEKFKGVSYRFFKHNRTNFRTFLRKEVATGANSLWEVGASLSHETKRRILHKVFNWLAIQQSSKSLIPHSVLDPHYIWVDEKNDQVTLYGNPGYQNELLYYQSPSKIWRSAIGNLFKCLFEVEVLGNNVKALPYGLTFWQFRLLQLSKANGLSLKKYTELALIILTDTSDSNRSIIDPSYFETSKIVHHYINDGELTDKLFRVIRYVENSWKHGSKDCYFYTLHNQEHARQLVSAIHLIIEESGFCIYLNKKEMFRLLTACYLHDIAMLSPPSSKAIYDKSSINFTNLSRDMSRLPVINPKNLSDKLNYKLLFDVHKGIENFYESLVRDRHPYVSEQELNSDYPQLPLSVAERRDVGIISASHGWYKSQFKSLLTDDLHDGRHPLNLKLLSLLLRIADLCDVSSERVSREVIDRNFQRMNDISIFHWAKHLSVESIRIERTEPLSTKSTTVKICISHKYLPNMHLEEDSIKSKCESVCKIPSATNVISKLCGESKDKCRFHCIFINAAYKWFFEEINFINDYFQDKKIPLKLELDIVLSEHKCDDLIIVKNRNETIWAQEFLRNFFLG
ncbi:RNA-directed DNA polymerase [Geomonas anaerohicana]|uniref:RNA-directed DNA polymerase n=1 Tax=Geomonas anaerohicana TaxID=2798583 RepID=A0ABS0YK59_9BACT|nr:RNA-directed DNA polymerase [Geomonas anaerohicana]MBJ6752709.1 RNA-directed DNA polymerase [Geomonas anaerohicana]